MVIRYRYGFNGKEKTDEIEGTGNSYDFGARMYDPRLGKWLSLDPLQMKYPGLSPYHAMADNPILVIDVEGNYNTIYLLAAKDKEGKTTLTKEKAQAIAAKANEYFEKLGVETRVVYFDESSRGEFNVENIDYTDNVAVVGESPNAVVNTLREKVSPTFADDRVEGSPFTDKGDYASNPEKSNNRSKESTATHGNTLGIAVRTDQALDNFYSGTGLSEIEGAALSLVHGAGHNTSPINKFKSINGLYGHLNSGVMSDGNELRSSLQRGLKAVLNKNDSGNKFYKSAMTQRYGAGKQKDNYNTNRKAISNGTAPAYKKE